MTLQQKIGLKIKNLRETCGLSQTELALKVGYKDKTSIAKIEKGLVDLPQSKLSAFSAAFKVNTSYWFDDEKALNLLWGKSTRPFSIFAIDVLSL